VIQVRRAADRFRTLQSGITTWHSFSSGAHYDPDNLSFGPVVACDEHLVDPCAGFARHPHARVELISWVVEGALHHDDGAGRVQVVVPGRAQYQLAGLGIEHAERNASESEPLHFVQLWLMCDEDVPDYDVAAPPLRLAAGAFRVVRAARDERVVAAPFVHLYVAAGRYAVGGHDLGPGDSLRAAGEALDVDGDGQLLIVATVEG
jgi:hypothetical protein